MKPETIIDVNRLYPEVSAFEEAGFKIAPHNVMPNWKRVTLPDGWHLKTILLGLRHKGYQLIDANNNCKGQYLVTSDIDGTKLELRLERH